MSKRIRLHLCEVKILFQNLAHARKFYAVSTALKPKIKSKPK